MFGNNYKLLRAEANYILKLMLNPDMKRNKKIEKAIAKRIKNCHRILDWNCKKSSI